MLKLKQQIREILANAPRPKSVDAETNLILYHFFQEEMRSNQPLHPSPEVEAQALSMARERATGIPLQHLLGYQYFYEHEYQVSPSVLIPRPETEILVQSALGWIKTHGCKKFAELGLGSGAISCELLSGIAGLKGLGSEVSVEAQAVARANLFGVVGIDWQSRFEILTPSTAATGFEIFLPHAPFDLIVSNPPYVSGDDEIEDEVLEHEPHLALFPDKNPNYFYENFVQHAKTLLAPHGAAFFEVPHERAEILSELHLTYGMRAELIPDLTGRSRVLKVTLNT